MCASWDIYIYREDVFKSKYDTNLNIQVYTVSTRTGVLMVEGWTAKGKDPGSNPGRGNSFFFN
jgi:hypothetical protein